MLWPRLHSFTNPIPANDIRDPSFGPCSVSKRVSLNVGRANTSTFPKHRACDSTRQTWIGGTMLSLRVVALGAAMAVGFATTGSAQGVVPPARQEVRHDTRDIRSDRRDVRSDTRDIRHDRRNLRSDGRGLVRDRRAIRRDRRQRDLVGLHADRRHFRHDARRTRRDHRALKRNRFDRRNDFRSLRSDRRDRRHDVRGAHQH